MNRSSREYVLGSALPVDIQVDPTTGGWFVHGVPMVLVPRHLLTHTLTAIEAALGSSSASALAESGRCAAAQWCAHEEATSGRTGVGLLIHYLQQLTARGWGQFSLRDVDLKNEGACTVIVAHSTLAMRPVPNTGTACYLFASWLEGAVGYLQRSTDTSGRVVAQETHCRAAGEAECRFELRTDPDEEPQVVENPDRYPFAGGP